MATPMVLTRTEPVTEGVGGGKSREPPDTKWTQQRLPSYRPHLTPTATIAMLLSIGVVFLATGLAIRTVDADEIFQRKEQYSGDGTSNRYDDCHISKANEGRVCEVRIKALRHMKSPVYVYYEIENFYQNHERYVISMDSRQLLGENLGKGDLLSCSPLKENGTKILSPCGLVANTLFNDVITLKNNLTMRETDIAWNSDRTKKYMQPQGFDWSPTDDDVTGCLLERCSDEVCDNVGVKSGCKGYICRGGDYDGGKCVAGQHAVFYYRDSEQYQYLYETFPQVVSPIVGVKNEHFLVWMRTAAMPTFRKLYGRITDNVPKNTELVFQVENNFDVNSFNGKKRLVISTASNVGAKPKYLWLAYVCSAGVCFGFSLLFFLKLQLMPRKLGNTAFLNDQ